MPKDKGKRERDFEANSVAKDLRQPKYKIRKVANKKKLYKRETKADLLKNIIEREE